MRKLVDVRAAFGARVERQQNGCWLWVGTMLVSGYGVFTAAGQTRRAHRASYEIHVGPIPAGMELDHLCRVKRCVNPQHLDPVPHRENMRRSPLMSRLGDAQAAKLACPNGHLYDETNTRITREGHRKRRACHREREGARYRNGER